MAQNEAPLTAEAGASSETDSRQIQADIDRTRAHMDRTFDALESKLTPGQLLSEGWGLLKGGSGAGARKLFEVAREHPLPAAVIGLGLGILVLDMNRQDRERQGDGRGYAYGYGRGRDGRYGAGSPDYPSTRDAHQRGQGRSGFAAAAGGVSDLADQAKDKMGDLADQAKGALGEAKEKASDLAGQAADKMSDLSDSVREQASELGERVQRGARKARLGFWQLMEERPLVVGATVLAAGLLIGLSIPATEAEDELLGETRDQLLDRAQEGAREMLDKGKQVAGTVADRAKQVAEEEGLTPEKLAEKVKHVGREAAETAKSEASQAMPQGLGQTQGKPEPPQGQAGQGADQPGKPAGEGAPAEAHEPELARR
jgi:gas vesicle protein